MSEDKPCPIVTTQTDGKEFPERYHIMNEIYGLIAPILAKYEAPYRNSHHAAQKITKDAVDACQDWVRDNIRGN